MENELCVGWLKKVRKIVDYIEETQMETIKKAANVIATSITSGHFCYVFGTGHSHMMAVEMFPRYGGILGVCPILSTPLNWFTRIIGDLGVGESTWLESREEYGRILLEDYYDIHPRKDSIIVCSHSGITPVAVEIALRAKEKGATVIGVCSISHAESQNARHSSGKKLFEVADIVIDTGVPIGDVMIDVPGLEIKMGPGSSIANIVIANMLSIEVARIMIAKGTKPLVVVHPGVVPNAEEKEQKLVKEFRRRIGKHLLSAQDD